MQRIITYTRIHDDKDEDQLIINGILNAEFQRQREKDRKYINMLESSNGKHIRAKLNILRAMVATPCNNRIRNKIRNIFIFVLGCIIVWSQLLGIHSR